MVCTTVLSDKGPYRQSNQDACCVLSAQTSVGEVGLAVVCDGVGGLFHGDVASSYVTQRFAAWFREVLPELVRSMGGAFDTDLVLVSWDALLESVHGILWERGRKTGNAMGTTFTGAIACGSTYVLCQVGDSRLYRVRDGSAIQVTKDQSFVSALVEQGEVSASEAQGHPFSNVILQAVGASKELCPVFSVESLEQGDLLVLCSDGACRKLGAVGVGEAFGRVDYGDERSLHAACNQLVASCRHAGERDNGTVACLFMGKPPAPSLDTVIVGGGVA